VGNWTILQTDCEDFEQCKPTFSVAPNTTNSSWVIITITYPSTSTCNSTVSGTSQVVDEEVYLGQWVDNNSTSPLFGSSGVLHLDNLTLIIMRPQTTGTVGNCSVQLSNSTNTSGVSNQNGNTSGTNSSGSNSNVSNSSSVNSSVV